MNNSAKLYSLLSLLLFLVLTPAAKGYTEIKQGTSPNNKGQENLLTKAQFSEAPTLGSKATFPTIYKQEEGTIYLHGTGLVLIGFLGFVGLGLFYYLFLLLVDLKRTHAKFNQQKEELSDLKRVGFGKLKLEY